MYYTSQLTKALIFALCAMLVQFLMFGTAVAEGLNLEPSYAEIACAGGILGGLDCAGDVAQWFSETGRLLGQFIQLTVSLTTYSTVGGMPEALRVVLATATTVALWVPLLLLLIQAVGAVLG